MLYDRQPVKDLWYAESIGSNTVVVEMNTDRYRSDLWYAESIGSNTVVVEMNTDRYRSFSLDVITF